MLITSPRVDKKEGPQGGATWLAHWFWIFRDPVTGLKRSTGRRMTSSEAREYPMAQAVPGTLQPRNSDIDFEDTAPLVFHDVPRQ